jgi:hypothetical protein
MRPFILAALVAAGVGTGLAIISAPDPEAETLALIADARLILEGHKTALYRAVEVDEGIILRTGLSDHACKINIGFFDANWTRAKCEVQP